MPTPDSFQLDPINPKAQKIGPGHPPPSRRRGVANKLTRDLKKGIVDAAANVGRDGNGEGGLTGFLEDLALHHKKAFAGLLGKVLPMTIGADNSSAVMVGTINIVSVPAGHNEDGSPMAVVNPPIIEHTPQCAPVQDAKSRRLAELKAMPLERLAELAGVDIADVVED
ncbi:hypothetical protein [Bradyrhizobium sp. 604_D8_N2_3]|uniref:hypothetical protein n=1 Tax=Bradyrhizobium sp. 604_D8_N2_3 TaxID=3240370 RepID=UPI003F24A4DD